ncbi:MAG: STAS domain-containing protein [Desulfobacteraceae bacterium]|nr:STAS domain-containing protein [Desulfobacteraceae bacterium]
MTIEMETINGSKICRLNGVLGIWEAAAIWQQIHPLLASSEPLTVDMAQVSECDGAGVQIICQIRQAAQAKGKKIRLGHLSEPVLTALRIAGLDQPSQ